MTAADALFDHFGRIAAVSNAIGILQWDSDAMMPEGAAATRAESMAALSVIRHDLLTDPRLAEWLSAAQTAPAAGLWEQANLREVARILAVETAVPADLVAASSRAVSACEMQWRTARAAADFAMLRPALEEVLRLQREIGAAKGARLGVCPYDALLNDYEPGARSQRIDALFDDLGAFLPGFMDEVAVVQARRPQEAALSGPFSTATQRSLGLEIMTAMGFDFSRGRLDISAHPFCGGADNDVRITTRYDENDFLGALLGIVHETGHALYEQGRPQRWIHQPVGQARGMSVHESQSLLMEMQVFRSRAGTAFLAPKLRAAFDRTGGGWSADALWRRFTRVQPGFIRIEADEVTYPAHIILRYRLEKALIGGDLSLADLPGAWNEGMRELLGIVPPDDRFGCLQDIHWPSGGWGYFPTYTLGAMTAAQMFDAACRAEPEILPGVAKGDFAPLTGWLHTHVHSLGSLYETDMLLTRATGRPLDAVVYKAHLRRRYIEEAV